MRKISFFIAILFIALVGNINAQTDYGITIAGVEVTSDNCNGITGERITGSVSYNDATKTLTLDNATIEGNISFGTAPNIIEDITITLVGENTITTYIRTVSNTKTINGTGSLKVGKWIDCSLDKKTIIEDCTIDINTSNNAALYSGNGDGSKLTIKNANISAEAMLIAIGIFKDIELIGCEIVEPANAQIIDNEVEVAGRKYAGKYICDGDGNIAKKVVIKPISYGIEVAGVKVTSANCDNITGAKISGSVSYNDGTKTLTLDNAIIDGDISFGEPPVVQDITITLVGENAVTGYIVTVKGTKRINGTGSLKARGGIYGDMEQNTIIEDCTIEIDGLARWAIAGNSKLTIKNANVSVESNMVAIGDFADIELIGCEIVEPVNAQIIDTTLGDFVGKFICNEDGTFARKVVIKKLSGLNDIAQSSINIYPNPASDFVTIEGKGEIVITNSLGQVVKEIKDNSTYRTLNIKDFERGVYYIKVGNTTQKLVIE